MEILKYIIFERLNLFREAFLLLLGVDCNSTKNQTNNKHYKKKDCKLVHFYSSLLSKIPNNKNTTKMSIPSKNAAFVIFSGVAILPITNAIKSAWHKLRKILVSCFRCSLSRLNFIILVTQNNYNKNNKFCQVENVLIKNGDGVFFLVTSRRKKGRPNL